MNNYLTRDTQAIILLCGVLGKESAVKPLSLTEYSKLVQWLINVQLRPGDLLVPENIGEASIGSGLDNERLKSLLVRGVQLGFAIEEWNRNGIWIISRSDEEYPVRYKKHLKDKAPPLLFGVGNRALLQGGGLGIVGSRNVDGEGEAFTRNVAELCALNQIPVVSGGARGVDQISMKATLEAGGFAIGVLAENLLKKSLERDARHAIADERLLLLSPYHPNARFTVGTAMGRNKLIYAMADYGLVVSSEYKKGGTWAGAEEELRRDNAIPVFVRVGANVPSGNTKLLDLGATSWPASLDHNMVQEQLKDLAYLSRKKQTIENQNLFDFLDPQASLSINPEIPFHELVHENDSWFDLVESKTNSQSIYRAVLPVILQKLDRPTTADELAKTLDVNRTQLLTWLQQAAKEKVIKKLSNPGRYEKV